MKNWPLVPIVWALLLAGCAGESQKKDPNRPGPVTLIDGAVIYTHECASCHGLDGKAQTPEGKTLGAVDLTDDKWNHGSDRASLIRVIAQGVDGSSMPAFQKKLDRRQIETVADYVREFSQHSGK